MPDIFESELNACLRSSVYFHLILNLLSLLTKTVLVLKFGLGFFKDPFLHFAFPGAFILISFLLAKLEKAGVFTKQFAIFMSTEIYLIMLKNISYDIFEHRVVVSFFATGALMNYQIRIVTSSTAILFIGIKHIFQWYLLDVINDNFSNFHPFCLISMAAFLALMHIQGSHRRAYINEIKEFKASIKQSNKNFKRIMNTLQGGLVTFDKDFCVKLVNPKAVSLLDSSKDEFINTLSILPFYRSDLPEDFVFTRIQDQHAMPVNSNINLGSVLVLERHINLNLSKIDWGDDFIYVLLLCDVSATVDLERSILENELKSRFLNFIPHELQTPTVGILGCTENLLDSDWGFPLGRIKSSLEIILYSSRRLHSMICNISDYTQIISGHFSLSFSLNKLSSTIESALQMVRSCVRSQNLAIRCRIDPHAPEFIETDHQRLLQVILILLYNSLKYTYRGFIEVVALLENNSLLRIEINDSGIGITPEKLAIIKQQLRNPKPGNLIFGLEVSDFIARELGEIPLSIKSERGTSVSFFVSLQNEDSFCAVYEDCSSFVCAPEEANSIIEVREFSVSKSYCQVLIVDDTESSREVLARILERANISFLEARDGKQAVKTVKERDRRNKWIEVVIMDIDMPVMNGWEATEKIMRLADDNKISKKPFIVGYSAFTAPSVIERAHGLGMISYIKKPARAQDILRVIKSLLIDR